MSAALHPIESHGNFDLVKRVALDFTDVSVSKWRSRTTGLNVVHLDYQSPIVNGYFVVATEIFNDTGCPHTLEHLVFMGSEKYPYKGIIDHLANRGFSEGTNAWTDTDHTAYTASTAGSDGFLQLLPIYVDHILYPTITKAGFITEVHHIDGNGKDSGVVYSEMQGRENGSGDIMALRCQQLVNPPGSAYRSETGGLMEALRVLSVEQIRDYHHTYYVPQNLSLIISGKLSGGTSSLLSLIQEQVEPSLIAHGQNKGNRPPGWKRPFVETASAKRLPISETTRETVQFPEKDESMGEILINFMGPPPNQFLERKALDLLGNYLTSSAVAPLTKEFVETDSPLCTYIYFDEEVRATLVNLPVYIGSVPTNELETFDSKLKASLEKIVSDGFDMDRMAMVINRDERQLRSKLESAKGDTFSDAVISDFLYGPEDGSELAAAMDEISLFNTLRAWSSAQWADILKKYYVDPPCVVIIGQPSAAMADRLETTEKARIAAQIESLGPNGLKKAEEELAKAKAEHDTPIPTDILTSFPVPSVDSISWIDVKSLQQPGTGRQAVTPTETQLSKHISSDGQALPFFVQYDHVTSDFVTVNGLFSLINLPDRLRPYIPTYLLAFFALPVQTQSGQKLTHEEVVNRLDNETVSYEAALGVSDTFTENFRVSVKIEAAQYATAVAWLNDLVYGAEFNKDRLQVTLAKIQQSLPGMKRSGSNVLSSVWNDLIYDHNAIERYTGVIPQTEFIPQLVKELQDSPDDVIAAFNEIRDHLTNPTGIRFSVTGNVLGLEKPRSVWAETFGKHLRESKLLPVPLSCQTLSSVGKNPVKKAIVMGLSTIESAYATHTAKGIQGFNHSEYPAMRVALEVLNATESYLWRYIRGSGLAYGAYVSSDAEAGLLSFSLYRSSNSLAAFAEAAKVLRGLVDETIPLETTTLDAAKSSIVFGITRNVSTAGRAAMASFTNQALKGVSQNHQVELLPKCQAVDKAAVIDVLRRYFIPLFDSSTSVAVVVTAPAKVAEIVEGLDKYGFSVETRDLKVDPKEDDFEDAESDSERD